jgi:transposase-like protein
MNPKAVERRPGRPRAIPEALIPKVISLYQEGLGYRAVARELRREGISADWSTIRRIVKTYTKPADDRK